MAVAAALVIEKNIFLVICSFEKQVWPVPCLKLLVYFSMNLLMVMFENDEKVQRKNVQTEAGEVTVDCQSITSQRKEN